MKIAGTFAIIIWLSCFIATFYILGGCTPRLDSNGCFGYTYKTGLQRGTLSGWNSDYVSPYRQCVEKEAPHRNTERRPNG